MIHYSNHPPNVKDYCELRVKAGMSPKSETAAQKDYPMHALILLFMKNQH